MARKQYEIALLIGGKVQSSMSKAFGAANKQMQLLQKQTQKSNSLFRSAAGIAAGYFSISAVKNFASESTQAFKNQLAAETKLEAILKNNKALMAQGPEAYKQAKAELVGVAQKMQKVGIIGDEISLAGFQQLATFQLSQKEITVLSGGMADLLAQQKEYGATQQDAVNIANMIGKVMDGQVGSLKRVGISFSEAQEKALKLGNRTQRAAVLAQVLQENVGGVNAALAKTDTGKIQNANMQWADYKEIIGSKIIPLQAKFGAWFVTKLPALESGANKFFAGVDKGVDILTRAAKFYDSNKTAINTLTVAVFSAVAAFKAMSVISGVITTVKTFSSVVGIAASGPVGWAILAVGALAAAGYLLYKNWYKVSAKMAMVWGNIKNSFFAHINSIIDKVNWFIDKLNLMIQVANKVPGINISQVSHLANVGTANQGMGSFRAIEANAKGTNYARGGWSLVGERGRELVDLPRGSRVIPNNRTESLLKGLSGRSAVQVSWVANITIQGNADEATVKKALDKSQDDFERRFGAFMTNKKRLSFAGEN